MDTLTVFSIVILAGLIHTSFQLGVSMITLLHGHSTGKQMLPNRTLKLMSAFTLGTIIMITLIATTSLYASNLVFGGNISPVVWELVAVIMLTIGLVVWVLYYRKGEGTLLWVPRGLVQFLSKRINTTRLNAEAFSLGLSSVFIEILFFITPLTSACLALSTQSDITQLVGLVVYIVLSSLSVIVFTILIGGGHNVSTLQKWRETNKHFLQFAGGSALVILALFLFVNQFLAPILITRGW